MKHEQLNETMVFNKDNVENNEYVLKELVRYTGQFADGIEDLFKIEFSCGDGKFLNDLSGPWLKGEVSDEEFRKYDGEVDLSSPIRDPDSGKLLYRATFKIVWNDKTDEESYFLNGKLRSTKSFY